MKTMKEPNAFMPQKEENPGILTRPVRVTLESRLPGMKEVRKTATECERAIILSEEVVGAVRSEDDPMEFMEKRQGSVEMAGFQHPGDAVNMILSAVVAAVRQMSGEDEKRYETNFLTAAQILMDRSGISKEDLTLHASSGLLERRQQVVEMDMAAAAAN